MIKKENVILFLLAVCFVVTLPGCGSSKPSPDIKDAGNFDVVHTTVNRTGEITAPVAFSMKPDHIRVDHDYIYIVEPYSLLIYSRKNFKLVKMFGNKGEGPGQFRETVGVDRLSIKLFPDYVFVGSLQKSTYLTREGDLKKEIRLTEFTLSDHFPFYDRLLGCKYKIKKEERAVGISYRVFGIFETGGSLDKEICDIREPNFYEENGFINDMCTKRQQMDTCGDRIYISGRKGFVIDIYDKNGTFLKSLEHNATGRKLTEKEKEEVYNVYEVFFRHLSGGRYWPRAQRLMQIPDQFSAFHSFLIADEKIYVQTYKNEADDNADIYVFHPDGNLLEKISFPFIWEDICKPHVFTIKDNTLFQVVPNEETQANELRIVRMKD